MILKKFKEIKQIFFLQHQCHHFHENKTMFYMYQKNYFGLDNINITYLQNEL